MPGRDGERARRIGLSADANDLWQTWWALNRMGLLPDRTEALKHLAITPGDGDSNSRHQDWARRRAIIAERHVAPLLARLAHPEEGARDDVVASALIALAKVSQDPKTPALMLHYMGNARASTLVRESAALALGLLARTEPSLQRPPEQLDEIREALLAAFDDDHLHDRARAFAALALGLLGDQPFSEPYAKDGRLVTRALWTRLAGCQGRRGLTVALLTALGRQPAAGLPDGVRESLSRIVLGRRELKRRWDAIERSHALSAALRLGGPGTYALLARAVQGKRTHVDVRRAAYVALGELADSLSTDEREEMARLLRDALRRNRDPLTTGLGHLALGQVVGADLRHGSGRAVLKVHAGRELLSQAKNGATPTRGFSAIALALAVKDADTKSIEAQAFINDASKVLLRGLVGGRGDDRIRAAYAVAVGVAGIQEATEPLLEILSDTNADPELRGHAAVAIGQLGPSTPKTQRVLFAALAERGSLELRRQVALGTALLGGRVVGTRLLRELDTGKTELLLAQIVIALGRLGDLQAVAPIAAHATNAKRAELSQALAIVALGMLADPEPRPTLLRITQHANYPARTASLHEAFTIL